MASLNQNRFTPEEYRKVMEVLNDPDQHHLMAKAMAGSYEIALRRGFAYGILFTTLITIILIVLFHVF